MSDLSKFVHWFAGGPNSAHAPGEVLYWSSQITLAAIGLTAAIFAYNQIKTFKLFELLKFLQDERIVQARRTVRRKIGDASLPSDWWDTDDKLEEAASMACTGYDVLGLYLKSHSADPWLPKSLTRFFVKYWRESIIDLYKILLPYIRHRKSQHGEDYLEGFDWIYGAVRNAVGIRWRDLR